MSDNNGEFGGLEAGLPRRTVLRGIPAGALGLGTVATGLASAETVVDTLAVPDGSEVTLEVTISAGVSLSPEALGSELVVTVAGEELTTLTCESEAGTGCTEEIENETFELDVSTYAGETIDVAYEEPSTSAPVQSELTVEDYEFDVSAPSLDVDLVVPDELYEGVPATFEADVEYDGDEDDLEFAWGYAETPVDRLEPSPTGSPTHEIEFSSAGRYAVQVEVDGAGGSHASASGTVEVEELVLEAELDVPDEIHAGVPAEFEVDVEYAGDEDDLEFAWGYAETPVDRLEPSPTGSPTHEIEFSSAGRYAVQVEVDGAGDTQAGAGDIVDVEEFVLEAELNVPDEIYAGVPVQFEAEVEYSGDEDDLEYAWGHAETPVERLETGEPDSPTYEVEFSSPGSYAVQLDVEGAGDSSGGAGEIVDVESPPLEVDLVTPDDDVVAGQTVEFHADVEYGGDEDDLEYAWGHAEGTEPPSELDSIDDPTYVVEFPTAGEWTVGVEVDVDGHPVSTSTTVDVGDEGPTLNVDGPESAPVEETVEFEAEVEGCDDVTYAWAVIAPDDEESYEHDFAVFPYEFEQEGAYEVEVTAEGCDWSEEAATTVEVADEDVGPCPADADAATVDERTVCDLNGDGNYRDLDASGDVTAQDLQTFFANQHTEPWDSRDDLFDFNDDGNVGQPDVVDLFQHL